MSDDETDATTRRDFLYIVTGALGAVGVGAAAWPFIDQMNPSADVLAAGGPMDVDLSSLEPGQQITVVWRGKPIFIVYRTEAELKRLQEGSDISLLRDPNSDAHQQPEYARNWHRSIKPEYLVVVGICTHLGCIPEFRPGVGGSLGRQWPGAIFAPATAHATTCRHAFSSRYRRPIICRCRPTISPATRRCVLVKIQKAQHFQWDRSSRSRLC